MSPRVLEACIFSVVNKIVRSCCNMMLSRTTKLYHHISSTQYRFSNRETCWYKTWICIKISLFLSKAQSYHRIFITKWLHVCIVLILARSCTWTLDWAAAWSDFTNEYNFLVEERVKIPKPQWLDATRQNPLTCKKFHRTNTNWCKGWHGGLRRNESEPNSRQLESISSPIWKTIRIHLVDISCPT